MLQPWRVVLLGFACLAVMIACGSCAASASAEYSASEYVPAEVQVGSASPAVSEATIDNLNHYPSTVLVTSSFFVPKQGMKLKTCSGVLIDPHVVLTAGHCVCHVRKPAPPEASDTTIIDTSTCARTAEVTLLRYESTGEMSRATPGAGATAPQATKLGPYSGAVQPHEGLRIVYKEVETSAGWETSTEYSNADLAVIVLEESLQRHAQPIKLAKDPVRLKERVVLVGYGAEIPGQPLDVPVRRYGENAIVSIKEDGSTFHIGRQLEIVPSYSGEKPGVIRQRGSYVAAGDSGGPCFRERKGTLELVGIARSTHGPPIVLSVYTSTHAYLGWLRQKIASAGNGHTD